MLHVNVYAISRAPQKWTLIDCVIPHCAERIKRWARNLFGSMFRERLLF
jgi:hypothetical protein